MRSQPPPTFHPTPHVEKGVHYWQGVPPTVDGVLGGYGNGTLPVVDAQGSRAFLLEMLPRLSAIPPASCNGGKGISKDANQEWIQFMIQNRGGPGRAKTVALDCGAGVGRVTRDALSRIVDIVHLVEPVESFLNEAKNQSTSWPALKVPTSKAPLQAKKAVHFHLSTLQDFDPAHPYSSSQAYRNKIKAGALKAFDEPTISKSDTENAELGHEEASSKAEPVLYDVIWGQWCLQHLSDKDLVAFLNRSKVCLKPSNDTQCEEGNGTVLDGAGIIVVKENVLRDTDDGSEGVWYDDEDHSITRTPNAYERVFREAGLEIVSKRVQQGLPEELFPVMMWCLRVPISKKT